MARIIVGTTMSLDGFIADANGGVDLLYSDLTDLQDSAYMNSTIEQTGAVIMGRKTFAMGDPDAYAGNYAFQAPIFVVTHHPPRTAPKQDERLTFTFVSDGVQSAVAQAKAAGLVDELHIDIMPVLLGDGLRLFETLEPTRVHLQKQKVLEVGARTCLRFRVGA